MVIVDPLFTGDQYKTKVYAAACVIKALYHPKPKLEDARLELLQKIEYYATEGFPKHEGKKGKPIRPEGNQIFRIGLEGDLFRLIGFYEKKKTWFLLVDQYTKSGQKLNASQRKKIEKARKIRGRTNWQERDKE